jgi:hypothetical protein
VKIVSRRHLLQALGTTGALCLCHGARAQWPNPGAQPANVQPALPSGTADKAVKRYTHRQSGWGRFGRSGCTFSGARPGSAGMPQISIYSGRPDVDQAYQDEGVKLTRMFNVRPAGGFMDDSSGPNAFATTERFYTNSYDGTVIFGVNLIAKELQRDRGKGISVPAIMAHEFAHVYQFKEGSLRQAATPVRELQADFLAGWYVQEAGLDEMQVRPAMESFFEMGDFNFNSPDHHGTPQERLDAFNAGYECGELDISSAFDAGRAHVGV